MHCTGQNAFDACHALHASVSSSTNNAQSTVKETEARLQSLSATLQAQLECQNFDVVSSISQQIVEVKKQLDEQTANAGKAEGKKQTISDLRIALFGLSDDEIVAFAALVAGTPPPKTSAKRKATPKSPSKRKRPTKKTTSQKKRPKKAGPKSSGVPQRKAASKAAAKRAEQEEQDKELVRHLKSPANRIPVKDRVSVSLSPDTDDEDDLLSRPLNMDASPTSVAVAVSPTPNDDDELATSMELLNFMTKSQKVDAARNKVGLPVPELVDDVQARNALDVFTSLRGTES